MAAQQLREFERLGRKPQVTAEDIRKTGRIPRVKVLGWESANGNRYLPEAATNALPLYENAPIFIDHRDGDRSWREWVGNVKKPVVESDGIYAGHIQLRKQADAFEEIVEAATEFYENFGMSHVADCNFKRNGGVNVVHAIEKVHSVDIVLNPATVAGFYESEGRMAAKKLTIGGIIKASETSHADNVFRKVLVEMTSGDAPMVSPDTPTEAAPADGDSEAAVRKGIMAAIAAKLESAPSDQLKKVLKALELGDSVSELVAGKPVSDPAAPPDPAAQQSEATKLAARMGRIEAENLLLKTNREAKEPWIVALAGMTAEARKAFVDTLPIKEAAKPGSRVGRPDASPPAFSEQTKGGDGAERLEEQHKKRMERVRAKIESRQKAGAR